jgi:tripartite-type tricarboxylate transporter receptor subunit TctC
VARVAYPTRPVRLIVGFPVGATADVFARKGARRAGGRGSGVAVGACLALALASGYMGAMPLSNHGLVEE